MSQKRIVLDERENGGVRIVNERPTISNINFDLVPNIHVEVNINRAFQLKIIYIHVIINLSFFLKKKKNIRSTLKFFH